MRKVALEYGKTKLMAGVMLAALLSACSSDTSRFSDDPFGNPFKGSSRFDPVSTGSIKAPSGRDMRKTAYEPVTTGAVTTQALSSPGQSMPAPSQPILSGARSSVQGLNPSGKISGLNPSGVAAANYPALAPVAQRSGSALSGASTGWTAVGGTPVTLGQGDSVASLSGKYGVPASAILAVNGLSPSSKLSSGQQLMIPAYNAVQGSGGTKSVIQRPVAALAPMPPKPVERVFEAKEAVPTLGAPSAKLAAPVAAAPAVLAQAAPKLAGPARQVGAPVESEAEKRAAAKLRELKNTKSAVKAEEDDETPVRKRVEAAKATPVAALKSAPKPAVTEDDDEDDAPAKKRVEAPKTTPKVAVAAPVKTAEDPKLKAARLEVEKARQDAAKARAEADKAKADMEKAKLAKADAVKLDKAKAEKVASAEKAKADKAKADKAKLKPGIDDDNITTASIPAAKLPARAAVEPKLAAKSEPVKAEETAKETGTKETASTESFRWPAKGRVISGFGARGTGGANDGINIAMPEGTPVRAAEGGTVVHADDALKGYGKMVLVRHPNGYVSVYAHNGELNVKRGESVKRGQVIAHSGSSGNVTAPQLHFELRKGSTPVDPTARLAD